MCHAARRDALRWCRLYTISRDLYFFNSTPPEIHIYHDQLRHARKTYCLLHRTGHYWRFVTTRNALMSMRSLQKRRGPEGSKAMKTDGRRLKSVETGSKMYRTGVDGRLVERTLVVLAVFGEHQQRRRSGTRRTKAARLSHRRSRP